MGGTMADPLRYDPRDSELDDVSLPKTRWHGSTVEVTARLVPRYYWAIASSYGFLDGRCILPPDGRPDESRRLKVGRVPPQWRDAYGGAILGSCAAMRFRPSLLPLSTDDRRCQTGRIGSPGRG